MKYKHLRLIAICYLVFPLVIFFFGWLRFVLAVPLGCFFVLASYKEMRYESAERRDMDARIDAWWLPLLVALIWVAFSGIGGLGLQNSDLEYRNAIFNDLVYRDWPVSLGSGRLLVYYFAYWLPAAIVGKCCGMGWANAALFLWTVLGVWTALSLFARVADRRAVAISLFLFVFFSGMDIFGIILTRFFLLTNVSVFPALGAHLEWWFDLVSIPSLQYSSHTTQLFWVFNQAVPAWVLTLLLLDKKSVKGSLFIWFLALPFAPFPFIGMIPIVGWIMLKSLFTFSWERGKCAHFGMLVVDLLPMIIIYGIFSAFYGINAGAGHLRLFFDGDFETQKLLYFALFLVLECFAIAALISGVKSVFKELVVVCLVLVFVPFFIMGGSNDFCMRVSIPALVWLGVLVLRSYGKLMRRKQILLVIILLVGAVTPFQEFYRSVHAIVTGRQLIANHIGSLGNPYVIAIPHNNFMSDSYEGSTFAKYLMKR